MKKQNERYKFKLLKDLSNDLEEHLDIENPDFNPNLIDLPPDRLTGEKVYGLKEKDNSGWITETKFRTPEGKIITIDPNEAPFEMYSFEKEDIYMMSFHKNLSEFSECPLIIVKPFTFTFIPHKYFTPFLGKVGDTRKVDLNVHLNFGNKMFINNLKTGN